MAGDPGEPEGFEVGGDGPVLRGESLGSGRDLILCHGLSATRRFVVHGSKLLPRRGYRLHSYDARGHGESDPAGPGEGYGYDELTGDLQRVVKARAAEGPVIVVGHSMGCHTAAAWALADPAAVEAMVLIGPVYTGEEQGPDLTRWDERAEALETGGPEAFGQAAAAGMEDSPEIYATVERLARERSKLHRHPEAVADALREVPRSRPFGSVADLKALGMPVLVVASRDEADPGHPYAVSECYAERLPNSELICEEAGDSPLAWQGGRLSREIDAFLARHGIGPSAATGGTELR